MGLRTRFLNDGDVLTLRNDGDDDNGDFVAREITLTGGAPDDGKILTSDSAGKGSWETNPAIQSAADAQTAADNAQTAADAAAADAAAAQVTADGAVLDASVANGLAVAAQLAADAAAAAAVVANGLAVAAGIDAGTALTRANDAYALADVALDAAQRAYPEAIRVFGDELNYVVGTPTNSINTSVAYNAFTVTTTNGADARIGLNLRAGTWTFKFRTIVNSSGGRVTIVIGSVVLADPQELYQVTQDLDKTFTYAGVVIPASDRYELRFLVNGKNASSSGFGLAITKFLGYRTGV